MRSLRFWLLVLPLITTTAVSAQVSRPHTPFILDSVETVGGDVFDTLSIFSLLNRLHMVTKDYVVAEEVFVVPGDTVTANDIDELERNLRNMEIFSRISFEVVPLAGEEGRSVPRARLVVRTRDAFSLRVGGSVATSGEDLMLLGTLREVNFLGSGQQIGLFTQHMTGTPDWSIGGGYLEPNIGGSHIRALVGAALSRLQDYLRTTIELPYYSDRTPWAFSVTGSYASGQDFFYLNWRPDTPEYATGRQALDVFGWYSGSRGKRGSLFNYSGGVLFNRTEHDSMATPPRAYENAIGGFVGLHSLKRTYEHLEDADFTGDRLVPVGGMGSVTLGKIAPIAGGLDNMVYLGGEARQASRLGPLHLFGSIAAATGLSGKQAKLTIEKFTGTAHLKLGVGALAARLEQSTVWNWPRYLFLPIGNGHGLRGFRLLDNFGDNRLIANFEYRLFPIVRVLLVDLGVTAFYDIGSTWMQGEQLSDLRFHSSAGFGLRMSSAMGVFNRGLLRVDVAYNFDQRKISRLVISTQESFDAFGTLEFRPPAPYQP